ncbi:hypothetical protein PENTCL1PPCAC_27941, partial [Pristionchus entomophagus]
GPFHILVKDFKIESETGMISVETMKAHWKELQPGRWRLITHRVKTVPCDMVIVDQDLSDLTANANSISWSKAIVNEHSQR